ncbi:MAG: hypothetical protein HZA54_03440 [Planctomycetes bacterium]|nr:hypothetical protein [Planctomycetota bacterium]
MPLIVHELISRIRVGGAGAELTAEAVEEAVRRALAAAFLEAAAEERLEREAHPWRILS